MINLLHHKAWALEAGFARTVAPTLMSAILNGHSIDHFISKQQEITLPDDGSDPVIADRFGMKVNYDRENRLMYVVNSKRQNVAIIPILGAMTKRGDLCSYGMRDYAGWIQAVNSSDNYVGAVIEMECPGSTVDGIEELSKVINESKKPIVTFGDSMVASGGYWIASQTDWIIGNQDNRVTEFGSIGVLYVHEYWGKFIEDNIGSIEIIRAPQSVDKGLINWIEEMPKEARRELIEDLKKWADEFKVTVTRGRSGKITDEENVFTGKMYNMDLSLKYGLIDQIGTFQDALDKVSDLAKSEDDYEEEDASDLPPNDQDPDPTQQVSNSNFNMKFLQWLGLSKESADKLPAEEQQALGQAEEKLTKLEAENTVLKEQSKDKDKHISDLEIESKAKDNKIASLEKKLEDTPAGTPPSTDEDEDEPIVDENQQAIDALPHNQAADAMGFGGTTEEVEKK